MMTKKYREDLPPCPDCGQRFTDTFEAVEHMLEDNEDFNPYLVLPNGYKLMIGALLKTIFESSEDPQTIKDIVETTYMTLYTAETNPDILQDVITDLVVESAMEELDDSIKRILENGE
jgi:transcriptional regulator NrdR family protein